MATTLILVGLLTVMLSEIWAAYRAFRLGLAKGALAIMVPGYVLFPAKRHGYYQHFLISWVIGLALVAVGTIQFALK
jgi:hypothetical protein